MASSLGNERESLKSLKQEIWEDELEDWEHVYETTLLLTFKEGEQEFRAAVTSGRLSSRRLFGIDASLFALLAGFMFANPDRLRAAGHPEEVFNMMTSAVFYMLCMLLVMWPAPEDSAFTRAKHALRIPLHVVSYCIATSLFIHHIKLPGMAVCSPFVSEYSALEALAAYLLWPASYPMMAALPLALAVPLQLATFVGLYFANEPECAMGAPICPKTDDQYHLFNKVASVIGAGLPVSLPMASELTDDVTCHNIMTHLKLGISVIISFYVTYYAEISTRKAYALQVGRLRLADELQLRKQQVWQLCGELAVALILAWHLCVFSQQVPALMAGIFS